MASLAAVLLVCVLAATAASSCNHDVEWVIPSKPNALSPKAGDTVTFTWPSVQYHNVWSLPDQAAFDSCDFSKGTELAGTEGSPFALTIPSTPSEHFIACEIGSHCNSGQKIKLTVTEEDNCPKKSSEDSTEESTSPAEASGCHVSRSFLWLVLATAGFGEFVRAKR
eukprot:gnl/TRDRNA2_/TRDRNA2_199036_c0_seq1.p1 gnl/TRDRNA2_/TRDRNA2_199036_c0~~gnl/TRDRNA2_/TRDRNA2_199036_c0_seq1.p1  ORF type:complete len:176 (+),score=28.41 gnl/TRDRNA2_/TRDRNA2_199036_c0_seq1:30-530(+)